MNKNLIKIRDYFRKCKRYHRTMEELSRLTDRDLADMGMSRGDIPFIARRSADTAYRTHR